jgi:hypothetical protein
VNHGASNHDCRRFVAFQYRTFWPIFFRRIVAVRVHGAGESNFLIKDRPKNFDNLMTVLQGGRQDSRRNGRKRCQGNPDEILFL